MARSAAVLLPEGLLPEGSLPAGFAGVTGSGHFTFSSLLLYSRTSRGCSTLIGGQAVMRAHGPVTMP